MPNVFEDRIRTGRNLGKTTISITQKSFEVHKAIVSNAEYIFVFKQGWIRDAEVVAKWINVKSGALAKLPKYHYCYKYKYSDEALFMEPVT